MIIRIDGDGSVCLREATDLRRFSISMPATESARAALAELGRVDGPSFPRPACAGPFRSRWADSIYVSHSTDGGRRTEPAPAELPSNNLSIQAVRLANGHLAMVHNHFSAVDATG